MSARKAAQGHFRFALAIAFLAGVLTGGAAALAQTGDDLAALKEKFRRPAAIPFPVSNPYSAEKRALGDRKGTQRHIKIFGHLVGANGLPGRQDRWHEPRR